MHVNPSRSLCTETFWGKAVASRILLHRRLPLLLSQKYSKIFPLSNKSFGKTMTTDFVRKPCGFLFLINIFRDSGKYYVGTVSSIVDNHINTAAEEPVMGCRTVSHVFCPPPLMFLLLPPVFFHFFPLLVLHSIFLSAFVLNQSL